MQVKLSVIVPVFNEEKTVAKILGALLTAGQFFEVLVVDDGSTDQTVKEVGRIKNSKIRLVSHKKNQGKGAAIQTGLRLTQGDYVLIQDADLEYDPKDIAKLLKLVIQGKSKIVYGSRFLTGSVSPTKIHRLANWFLTNFTNLLYGANLSDMETCYKLLPTRLLRSLKISAQGFDFEPEVTAKILKGGNKIYEVPISYFGRNYDQGKKISFRDGIMALWILLKYRFFVS